MAEADDYEATLNRILTRVRVKEVRAHLILDRVGAGVLGHFSCALPRALCGALYLFDALTAPS